MVCGSQARVRSRLVLHALLQTKNYDCFCLAVQRFCARPPLLVLPALSHSVQLLYTKYKQMFLRMTNANGFPVVSRILSLQDLEMWLCTQKSLVLDDVRITAGLAPLARSPSQRGGRAHSRTEQAGSMSSYAWGGYGAETLSASPNAQNGCFIWPSSMLQKAHVEPFHINGHGFNARYVAGLD
ncbi:uncharacterized protein VTP21DRAFT_2888 [Calcarisporiella thermophila]|uniref:uncharacterized protein n=1 Tax=Calcarisporiella thermophila TaxID=911321 RepID=UPI003742F275